MSDGVSANSSPSRIPVKYSVITVSYTHLYLSDQQLETLHIPQLLARYMLIVLYPDNGRWTHAEEGKMCIRDSMSHGIL